jgi:hypothetical protein
MYKHSIFSMNKQLMRIFAILLIVSFIRFICRFLIKIIVLFVFYSEYFTPNSLYSEYRRTSPV